MRDIVVTIPAARLAAVEAEEADVARRLKRGEKAGWGGWQFYWEMGRLPKEKPRRIYFLWDGAVRAYHDVLDMTDAGECIMEKHTGRERDRDRAAIFMHPEIHEVEPIPMQPFRGFRYFPEPLPPASGEGEKK